ncbi:MAG: hypothetical protein A2452_06435 [Candidatus Firestonebacteria bacterium RIFOXYC2_FULL_39_67]|nr:MAG: hypothetical protein A2452_06435 [Candidatus Firestonebacteria bacterium RIFOXYC2_FULL_39_67]
MIILFAFVIFVSMITDTINAQETFTLKQILSAAKENNPRMVKTRKDVEAAKARLITAGTYPNPEIDFATGNFQDVLNNLEFGIGQEFDLFGKIGMREAIAEADISLANEELAIAWSEIALEIKGAYYDLLLMEKKNVLAQENLDIFRKFVDSVQIKYNSGSILLNEVARAKIELSQAENEYFLSDKVLRASKIRFNLMVNKPVSFEFTLSDALVFEQRIFEYKELTQKALVNNPELKIKLALVKRNNKEIELAQKEVFSNPKFGLTGKHEAGVLSIGAGLSIVLPFWNQNTGAIKEVELTSEKNNLDIEYIKKQIEAAVYESCLEAEYTAKLVVNYKKSIEQSIGIQSQINLQYKEGKTDFLTYLDSLRTVKSVKFGYHEAVVNYNKKIALIKKLTEPGLE